MVIHLDKSVFVAKYTLFSHDHEVKNLNFVFQRRCTCISVSRKFVALASLANLLFFIARLLSSIIISIFAEHDDLFGNFELTIDDEINAIRPITFLI